MIKNYVVSELMECGSENHSRTFSIKANISLQGCEVNCCSRALLNYISPYTATAVERLMKQNFNVGMVTTMDEFAMGSLGYSELFGITDNARFDDCIAGGSSSGAAVSVALEDVLFALGSSTGGSIRLPASLNQVVGFEPSYGAVSRFGLVSFANSLDKIGIIARSMDVVSDVFDLISGYDPLDMTSNLELQGRKPARNVGMLNFEDSDLDFRVVEDLAAVRRYLEPSILTLPEGIPFFEAERAYKYISYAEAYTNLSRFSGLTFGTGSGTFSERFEATQSKFGSEVKRRISLGRQFLETNEYISKGLKVRNRLITTFNSIFKEFEFLVLPTTNRHSVLKDELNDRNFLNSIDMYLSFTNIVKGCAVSFPGPVNGTGIQVVSFQGNDLNLLEFAGKLYQ